MIMICLSNLTYDNYLFILTSDNDKQDDRLYLKTINEEKTICLDTMRGAPQ